MEEFETFFAKIRQSTSKENSSLELTIDSKLVSYVGLKVGDQVKVMIKKIEVA